MITLRIAFRNIFRQKRRTTLTALTMFGGFTLAAISIGWSDGTYSYIINMFTRNQLGHIQIHKSGYLDRPSLYDTIDDYPAVGETVHSLQAVEAWAPRLYSAGLAAVGERSSGVQIIGIDPQLEDGATRFSKKVAAGRTFSQRPMHETILGKDLAKVLQAQIGDQIVVVSQAADGSTANELYTVIGHVDSGDELTNRVGFYLHLTDAQELFVLQGRVHEIIVIAKRLNQVGKLTKEIHRTLANSDLEVSPWQEFARPFYQAMRADQEGMWIMLFVIILVVAVGVLNTVLMSVLERRREYGVLKAIGTKPTQIFGLVLYEVNLIALMSILLGIAMSLLANYLLSIHGITLPEPFTYGGVEFSKMYSEINARSLYIPTVTVIIAATFVSIFPAMKAARTEPARAMRMH